MPYLARLIAAALALLWGVLAHAAIGRIDAHTGVDATGAAVWDMPLAVAAGVNGLKPELALHYHGHHGDSTAATGFTLAGLSRIVRCPATRAVDGRTGGVRHAPGDRFCLDGQPLVLIHGVDGLDGSEYRTEVDTYRRVFARGQRGGGPAWFEVLHRDGTTRRYGNDADSILHAPTGAAREWALNEVEDPFGNRITWQWVETRNAFEVPGVETRMGELLPREVRWTTDASGAGGVYRLRFEWTTRLGADQRRGWRWGAPVARWQRLAALLYEADPGSGFALVQSWRMAYPATGSVHENQADQPVSVTQCGPRECLPPTVFDWQPAVDGHLPAVAGPRHTDAAFALHGDIDGDGAADMLVPVRLDGVWRWHVRRAQPQLDNPWSGSAVNSQIAGYGSSLLLDFDGDGLRDLLTASPWAPHHWRVFRANGSGGFQSGVDTGIPLALMMGPVAMDIDGDGLDDLAYAHEARVWFRLNTGSGFGPAQATDIIGVAHRIEPVVDPASGSVDFDGDGRRDLLLTRHDLTTPAQTRLEGYLSTGTGFEPLFITDAATGGLSLDINGDGLTDIAYREPGGTWRVRLSTGNALLAPQSTGFQTSPDTLVRVLDHNGDGRDDLLRRGDDDTWRVLLAGQYSAAFPVFDDSHSARQRTLADVPRPSAVRAISLADVDGDGQSDLLFLANDNTWHVSRHGAPGGRLTSVVDGLGNTLRFDHVSLSRQPGHGTDATPVAAGERRLYGASLEVVARVEASDAAGGEYTLDYAYTGGKVSRLGRGFLGFAVISRRDSRYPAVHGVEVSEETTYRQDFPFIGRPIRHTVRRGDGHLVSELTHTWAAHVRAAVVDEPAGQTHAVYWTRQQQSEHETDPTAAGLGQTVRSTVRLRDFNPDHGLPNREIKGILAPFAPMITTVRQTTFDDAARVARHCLGLPSRLVVTRGANGTERSRTTQFSHSPVHCKRLTETGEPFDDPAHQLTTHYQWNDRGQLDALVLQPGSGVTRQTRWTYAGRNDLPLTEQRIAAEGASPETHNTWLDGLGVAASRTSPRGLTTTWQYDDFGRLTGESRPDGPDVAITWRDCPGTGCFSSVARYRVEESRADGSWQVTLHDAAGRVVGRETPLLGAHTSRQHTEYDAFGRRVRESVPHETGAGVYWVEYGHDLAGRQVSEQQPHGVDGEGGGTRRWLRDGLTLVTEDAEGRRTTQRQDVEGRPVEVTTPGGGTARYTYTPFGEPERLIDANGVATVLTYDARGLVTVAESPDIGRRTTAYNAFGERIRQADARNPDQPITWTWDALGRLVARHDPGDGLTTWQFHTGAGPQLGLLTSVSAPLDGVAGGWHEARTHDALGRLVQTTTRAGSLSFVSQYTWDAHGRPDRLVYPASASGYRPTFRHRYGASGHLEGIDQDFTGHGWWLGIYTVRALDALGRARHVTHGTYSPVDERRVHDPATTALREVITGRNGDGSIQHYGYRWDRTGNLVERTDHNRRLSETFGYDAEQRLTAAALNGTSTLSVSYDAAGRILSRSDVGHYQYGSERPGAVTAIGGGPRGALGFAYDANGNMTGRAGRPITWTAFNQPRRIDHGAGGAVELAYGPNHQPVRRVTQAGGGTVTTWTINPRFEFETEGATRRYRANVYAMGRLVYSLVEQDGPLDFAAWYVHTDHQGSIDTLTRAFGSGADGHALRYDAWGKRRNADWSADPTDARLAEAYHVMRGYTGHLHLDAVKLIHMGGRIQDPTLGVMLSPDPVLGALDSPQTLNRYAYVAGNPTSNVDASGYFLGRIGRGIRRAVRHVGSVARRVVRNYGREIAAAVVAYYTGNFASGWAQQQGMSYASAEMVGHVAGGAVGGGISRGDASGVFAGAISGATFGGIDLAYAGDWPASRIAAHAVAGGATTTAAGGDPLRGMAFGAAGAALRHGYNRVVGYDVDFGGGRPARPKGPWTLPREGVNNIGPWTSVVDPDAWLAEGGRISRFANHVPGINAVAGLHDVFQVGLQRAGGVSLRNLLNYPGMPVAAALTYPALLDGTPAVMMAAED